MFRLSVVFLFLFSSALYAAVHFPALSGRVVDEAHILDAGALQQIESRLASFEHLSGTQLVVVTLASLDGMSIEDYGYQLGRYWGIGQKGKNNGVLLIIVPSEKQTRIEVGYGLEGQLTDATSRVIIEREMLPHFKTGDYAAGIETGVEAILTALQTDNPVVPGNSAGVGPSVGAEPTGSLFGAILPLLFIYFIFRGFGRRRSGLIAPLILGSMLNRQSTGWGGSFSGFSGGGGSFGGGGASGRW